MKKKRKKSNSWQELMDEKLEEKELSNKKSNMALSQKYEGKKLKLLTDYFHRDILYKRGIKTRKKRQRNNNDDDVMISSSSSSSLLLPTSSISSSSPPPPFLEQTFLDLGQKELGYRVCDLCSMPYYRGQLDDEAIHLKLSS